jgi:hypothetical protein
MLYAGHVMNSIRIIYHTAARARSPAGVFEFFYFGKRFTVLSEILATTFRIEL